MREKQVEHYFVKQVEKCGGQAPKLTCPGLSGIPDRLVLLPGARAIFVELKQPGQKSRPLQVKRATELRALDFTVYCLDCPEAVDEFIRKEVLPKIRTEPRTKIKQEMLGFFQSYKSRGKITALEYDCIREEVKRAWDQGVREKEDLKQMGWDALESFRRKKKEGGS